MLPVDDDASWGDHDLSRQPLAASATTPHRKTTHPQPHEIILTLILYAFALCAALVGVSMMVARFLTNLFTFSFRSATDLKRRTEMRYPGLKVYIDAAFIGAGFAVVLPPLLRML